MECIIDLSKNSPESEVEIMGDEKFYYSEFFKKIANDQKVLLNKGMCEYDTTYVQSLVMLRLYLLHKYYGPDYEVTQKDIEKYLLLKASTVTHVLCRMEESGCIARVKSAKDSRANCITLTKKGESYLPLFFNVLDDVESQMTEGMTEAEKLQLKNLLQRVLENLERHKE